MAVTTGYKGVLEEYNGKGARSRQECSSAGTDRAKRVPGAGSDSACAGKGWGRPCVSGAGGGSLGVTSFLQGGGWKWGSEWWSPAAQDAERGCGEGGAGGGHGAGGCRREPEGRARRAAPGSGDGGKGLVPAEGSGAGGSAWRSVREEERTGAGKNPRRKSATPSTSITTQPAAKAPEPSRIAPARRGPRLPAAAADSPREEPRAGANQRP